MSAGWHVHAGGGGSPSRLWLLGTCTVVVAGWRWDETTYLVLWSFFCQCQKDLLILAFPAAGTYLFFFLLSFQHPSFSFLPFFSLTFLSRRDSKSSVNRSSMIQLNANKCHWEGKLFGRVLTAKLQCVWQFPVSFLLPLPKNAFSLSGKM